MSYLWCFDTDFIKNYSVILSDAGSSENSGDNSFQLSNNRYLTISEFKNKVRVDIREYYFDSTGERKPGKKGISLSLEEWNKITENMDQIEQSILVASGDK